jgi:hypothetical protein
MKIQIKNRYTKKIIIEGEANNIKEFLEKNKGANLWGADLWGADLREANLQGANLQGANLWGADLWGADLWGVKIKIIQKEALIRSLGVIIDE